MLRDAHVCKLLHSPTLFPIAHRSFALCVSGQISKTRKHPSRAVQEKANPGIALQRRHFVFLQYFLALASKYRITQLQGGPGPECSQLQISCIVPPQLPVLPTALTLLHPRTLVTPSPGGRALSFRSRRRERSLEGGNAEPSLCASRGAHLSLLWRFLSGQYQLLEPQQ